MRLGRDGWVLSGSLDGWGDPLIAHFDLVVFLQTAQTFRLNRLRAREATRFGADAVAPGGWRHQEMEDFIEWASRYDAGDLTWNQETRLACPKNLIGKVDVYQVTHHGLEISSNPVLLETVQPRVAVFNNGSSSQIYFQNVAFPVASATAGGATASQQSGFWNFGGLVAGRSVTLTDTLGHTVTGTIPTSSGGSIGAQFPATCP